jgi:uncharacterized integral membrane protein (TIGR00698 family)
MVEPATANDRGSPWGAWRGVVVAAAIATVAWFLSSHYGGPAMLFALLIGMAFHHLAARPRWRTGIDLSSSTILRVGVALLGLRLTFADVAQLGWLPVVGVAGLVLLTLGTGVLIARFTRMELAYGLLSGGAVAICGASAALAIASVLPKARVREEDVLFTVVAVTALSTIAMVLYPVLFAAMGLEDIEVGYLIGASIHDVAQVVGAGYSVSDTAGDIATFTKLLRVALLPVVLIVVALSFRADNGTKVGLPWFVVVFMALMVLRNVVDLPPTLLQAGDLASRLLLLTAIAALGVKTSLGAMAAAGPARLAGIVGSSLVLLCAALGYAHWVMV